MKKKRILHLITGLEVGGTEMMLLKTLPKLQDNFDNHVCCVRGHGPVGKMLEEQGIVVHYLKINNIFTPKLFLSFRKIVKEFNPDILITYLIHADLYGRTLGKICGIRKIVCSERGVLLNWEFLRFFDRLTKRMVYKYIVQTNVAKMDLMKKLDLPKSKFQVIPNAIDITSFDFEIDTERKRKDLNINQDNLVIICISKLRIGKGHEYLFQAFEKIYENNQKINLLIMGNGERKSELLKQIENYKSKNNIYFLGDRNDVKEILRISDIFVLPTLGEGMSNAILEAMATGLPIITTDIEVNKEIIENEKEGILIHPKNSHEIYEQLIFLINNPEERKRLGFNANLKAKKQYNLSIIVQKTSKFLARL